MKSLEVRRYPHLFCVVVRVTKNHNHPGHISTRDLDILSIWSDFDLDHSARRSGEMSSRGIARQ